MANVLLFFVVVGALIMPFTFSQARLNVFCFRKVPIHAIYEDKVVYTADRTANVLPLQKDCTSRGGVFNFCGSLCPSDAEICSEVCAYTCEINGINE